MPVPSKECQLGTRSEERVPQCLPWLTGWLSEHWEKPEIFLKVASNHGEYVVLRLGNSECLESKFNQTASRKKVKVMKVKE